MPRSQKSGHTRPGKREQKTMEHHHFSWENHHFLWENHIFFMGKSRFFTGKSQFLLGKSTISMVIFNSKL
jgi:hypothetical protein